MSRGIKILWVTLGCICALGIVLTATGFALGATGNVWVDRAGLHFGPVETKTVEVTESDGESFEDIEIRLMTADVELVSADYYGYEFNYHGTMEPDIEIVNGKLTVTDRDAGWHTNIFGLDSLLGREREVKLTIYVPSDAALGSVSLYTASGATVINGSGISIRALECMSTSGTIQLNDLDLETLRLDVASGDVYLNAVTAGSAVVDLMSGSLVYDEAQLDSLVLNIVSGNASLTGTVSKRLEANVTSGDVDLSLAGSENDYSFEIERISGDVHISGREVVDSALPGTSSLGDEGSRSGHIVAAVVSGSVNIDFMS